jgi:HD-GYP domain-containing protein (c-di-GMP phosphodiesterase class II)
MTKLEVSRLETGMVLMEDVYDEDGILLIGAHTMLHGMHIDFLARKLVDYVYIKDSVNEDAAVYESRPAKIEAAGQLAVEEKYKKTVEKFKEIYKGYKLGRVPVFEVLDDTVEPLFDSIMNDDSFARRIWQIHAYDDYTFDHSVRVSMISGLLAKWCGLDSISIKEAALAGLMHDVGKCNIPDEILNKPGELTEEEFKVMKTHSILGYILVKDIPKLSNNVQMAILQHHERVDGSGYPHGLVGKDIIYLAKILAVADVYCAMTQDRVYKKGVHPFEAMSYIINKCHHTLDFAISKTFLGNVAYFYIGHKVTLTNGQTGEIIMTYKDDPSRPMLRIGEDYIDMRRHMSLEIETVLDE